MHRLRVWGNDKTKDDPEVLIGEYLLNAHETVWMPPLWAFQWPHIRWEWTELPPAPRFPEEVFAHG